MSRREQSESKDSDDDDSTPSNTDTDESSSDESSSESGESSSSTNEETSSRTESAQTKEGGSSSTGYTTTSTRTGTSSTPAGAEAQLARVPVQSQPIVASNPSSQVRRSVSFAEAVRAQNPPKSNSSPSKSSKSTSSGSGATTTESESSDEESDSDEESSEESGTSTSVSVSASTESRSTAASGSARGGAQVTSGTGQQPTILAPPQGRIPAPPSRPMPEPPTVVRPPAVQPSAKPSASTESSSSSSSGSSDSSSNSSSSATSTATGTSASRSTATKSSATPRSEEKRKKTEAAKFNPPAAAVSSKVAASSKQPIVAPKSAAPHVEEEPEPGLERRHSRRLSKLQEPPDAERREGHASTVSPSLVGAHPDDVVRTEDDANTPPPSVKGSHELNATGRPGKAVPPPQSQPFDTPPPEPVPQDGRSAPLVPLLPTDVDQASAPSTTAPTASKAQPPTTTAAPTPAATPTVVTVKVPRGGDRKPLPVGEKDTTGPLRYSTSVRESVDSTTSSTISKSTESDSSESSQPLPPKASKAKSKAETTAVERPPKSAAAPTTEPPSRREELAPSKERVVRRLVREHLVIDYSEPLLPASPLPDACFLVPDEANVVKRCWDAVRAVRAAPGPRDDSTGGTVTKAELGTALRALGLTEHQVATLTITTPAETDYAKFVEAAEYQVRALFRTGLEALFAAHDPSNAGELSWTSTMRVLSLSGIAMGRIGDEVAVNLLPSRIPRSASAEVRFLGAFTQQQPATISLDQKPLDVAVGENRTVIVQGSPLCTLTSTARCEQLAAALRIGAFVAQVCRDAVFPGETLVDYRRVLDTLCGPGLGSKPHLLAHRFVEARFRPLARLAMLVPCEPSATSLPVRFKGIEHSFLAECYASPALRRTYVAPEPDKSGTAFLGGAPPPPPSPPTAAGLASAAAAPVAWRIQLAELTLPAVVLKGVPPEEEGQRFILISLIDKANKVLPCVRVACGRSKRSKLEWAIEPQDRDVIVRGAPEDVLYCEFCYEPREKGRIPKGAETIGVLSCGFATAQLRDLELGQSHLWVNAGTFWRRLPSKETSTRSCLCITGPPDSRLTVEAFADFPPELDFAVFAPRFVVSARHVPFLRFFRKAVHDHCAVSHNCQMALSTGAALQAMAVVEDPMLFDCICDHWMAELRLMTPDQRADKNGYATQRLLQMLSVGLAGWAASGGRRDAVEAVLNGHRLAPTQVRITRTPQTTLTTLPPTLPAAAPGGLAAAGPVPVPG